MGLIPDRWTDYEPIGKTIPGTRFIAFKVPLKEAICRTLRKNEWFTPQDVVVKEPKVSLVIDLTFTTRYYDKGEFEKNNVSHIKILCPGHHIPSESLIQQFFDSVDKFLLEHPDDNSLIGVHCTHGVNRTGFFICKYMIDKMKIDPRLAIADVGRARGHPIERPNYLAVLNGDSYIPPPSNSHLQPPSQGYRSWREGNKSSDDYGRTRNDRDRPSQTYRDRYSANIPSNWRAERNTRPNRNYGSNQNATQPRRNFSGQREGYSGLMGSQQRYHREETSTGGRYSRFERYQHQHSNHQNYRQNSNRRGNHRQTNQRSRSRSGGSYNRDDGKRRGNTN